MQFFLSDVPNSFNTKHAKNILIVGPGAIGLSIAYALDLSGYNVFFVSRSDKLLEFDYLDVSIKKISKRFYFVKLNEDEFFRLNFDLCFIATQAYAINQALDYLKSLFNKCLIVSLCNGAVDDILSSYQKKNYKHVIRLGISFHSASIKFFKNHPKNSYIVVTCAKGVKIVWGDFNDVNNGSKNSEFSSILLTDVEKSLLNAQALVGQSIALDNNNHDGQVFTFCDNIYPFYIKKWISNCLINTLCGAYKFGCYYELKSYVTDNNDEVFQVFCECFMLAQKIWPCYGNLFDKKQLFAKMIDIIFNFDNASGNSIIRHIDSKKRTEANFLSGKAFDYQNFHLLKGLHKKI